MKASYLVPIGITGLALVLRLACLDQGMKTHDEHISTFIAAGGRFIDFSEFSSDVVFSNDLLDATRRSALVENGNARLYNLLLFGWIRVFGRGDGPTRLMSVLFGTLTVPLLYSLALHLPGRRGAAISAAMVLGLHPLHVQFSVTSRAYALATCFSTAAVVLLLALFKERPCRPRMLTVGYVLCCVGAFFSHFLTAYLLPAHGLLILTRWDHSRARAAGKSLCVVLLVIATWAVATAGGDVDRLSKLNQTRRVQAVERESNVQLPDLRTIGRRTVEAYVDYAGLSVNWSAMTAGVRPGHLVPPLLLPVALALVAIRNQGLRATAFLLVAAGSPLAFAASVGLAAGHTAFFWPQYMAFGVPFLCALFGASPPRAEAPPWYRAVSRLGWLPLAALLLLGVVAQQAQPRVQNPFSAVNQRLLAEYEAGDVLLFPNATVAHYAALYLDGPVPILQRVDAHATSGYRVVLRKAQSGKQHLVADLGQLGFPLINYYKDDVSELLDAGSLSPRVE